MSWFTHIFESFATYLRLIAKITLLPWRFVDDVVKSDGVDEPYEQLLKRYAAFLITMYFVIGPYARPLLTNPSAATSGDGLAVSFREEILLLTIATGFGLVIVFGERKNKRLRLDTALNVIIPLILTAILLDTLVDAITIIYLSHHGVAEHVVSTRCDDLSSYTCLNVLLPNSSGILAISVAHSFLQGHFMALLLLAYAIGLDPLRDRAVLPARGRLAKVAVSAFVYVMAQLSSFHSNGIVWR